ncbi:hypothetical protein ONS96_006502 [Cadophora gregata f. sp. sojae]|nr:hypothetical protein ONS96_006502 [Cadophora gregata f. sp. sojae]
MSTSGNDPDLSLPLDGLPSSENRSLVTSMPIHIDRWPFKTNKHPTHEKTIGGIASLMSWEIARGNIEETALHMDGLARIVLMKGGLKEVVSD